MGEIEGFYCICMQSITNYAINLMSTLLVTFDNAISITHPSIFLAACDAFSSHLVLVLEQQEWLTTGPWLESASCCHLVTQDSCLLIIISQCDQNYPTRWWLLEYVRTLCGFRSRYVGKDHGTFLTKNLNLSMYEVFGKKVQRLKVSISFSMFRLPSSTLTTW